jgi:hypothetical protein
MFINMGSDFQTSLLSSSPSIMYCLWLLQYTVSHQKLTFAVCFLTAPFACDSLSLGCFISIYLPDSHHGSAFLPIHPYPWFSVWWGVLLLSAGFRLVCPSESLAFPQFLPATCFSWSHLLLLCHFPNSDVFHSWLTGPLWDLTTMGMISISTHLHDPFLTLRGGPSFSAFSVSSAP